MYGFEAYRFNSKMEKSTKYHYFDDETGTTNVHSFVLLMKVGALWQMQDAGKQWTNFTAGPHRCSSTFRNTIL